MSDSSVVDLAGTPGSPGLASGPARVVHGPDDFPRVSPGDVLVCRFTEPAWTALFGVVAAVVTETGGVLSHAAIVAREHAIPAVLAVPDAMTTLRDGETVTVDGGAGRVTG
jgi:phosphoenolpyruvate synthase/pyruvate phosphate dikinase